MSFFEGRGVSRSHCVRLVPAHFDRNDQSPKVFVQDKWTSYAQGPSSGRKYALFPVTELVPGQRPVAAQADDRFRTSDRVFIKGVSLRLNVSHEGDVRLLVFAFRNGVRGDGAPSVETRPFFGRSVMSEASVPSCASSEVVFDVMNKDQLLGTFSGGKFPLKSVELQNGPFAVVPRLDGSLDWKATDMAAFTSRFSDSGGRPVGTIYARLDGGASKSSGKAFKSIFRGKQTRQVELFVKLSSRESYISADGSLTVGGRPLELFVGFDSPSTIYGNVENVDVPSGAIMDMQLEIYYE